MKIKDFNPELYEPMKQTMLKYGFELTMEHLKMYLYGHTVHEWDNKATEKMLNWMVTLITFKQYTKWPVIEDGNEHRNTVYSLLAKNAEIFGITFIKPIN